MKTRMILTLHLSDLQVALCHLIFNITAILIFYPIPFMRWPLGMCKVLGRTTAQFRWFAILYLFVMFFIIPGVVMGKIDILFNQ